jgi:hypothetical protein
MYDEIDVGRFGDCLGKGIEFVSGLCEILQGYAI